MPAPLRGAIPGNALCFLGLNPASRCRHGAALDIIRPGGARACSPGSKTRGIPKQARRAPPGARGVRTRRARPQGYIRAPLRGAIPGNALCFLGLNPASRCRHGAALDIIRPGGARACSPGSKTRGIPKQARRAPPGARGVRTRRARPQGYIRAPLRGAIPGNALCFLGLNPASRCRHGAALDIIRPGGARACSPGSKTRGIPKQARCAPPGARGVRTRRARPQGYIRAPLRGAIPGNALCFLGLNPASRCRHGAALDIIRPGGARACSPGSKTRGIPKQARCAPPGARGVRTRRARPQGYIRAPLRGAIPGNALCFLGLNPASRCRHGAALDIIRPGGARACSPGSKTRGISKQARCAPPGARGVRTRRARPQGYIRAPLRGAIPGNALCFLGLNPASRCRHGAALDIIRPGGARACSPGSKTRGIPKQARCAPPGARGVRTRRQRWVTLGTFSKKQGPSQKFCTVPSGRRKASICRCAASRRRIASWTPLSSAGGLLVSGGGTALTS